MLSERESVQGIYFIRNIQTGESYVGAAKNIQKRLSAHIIDLVGGVHINPLLQESWNTYGPTSFVFGILEIVRAIEELSSREISWIIKLDAVNNGFNVKSNQHKFRTLVKINPETHMGLEELGLGSMNATLANLLKYYRKHH